MGRRRLGAAIIAACALASACTLTPAGAEHPGGPAAPSSIGAVADTVADTVAGAVTVTAPDLTTATTTATIAAPPAIIPAAAPAPTASTTGSTTAHSTASQPARPRTVSILGSGDVLLHQQLWAQAAADAATDTAKGHRRYDFDKIYADIAPQVAAADLAICQLETPVSRPAGPFSGWPRFSVPPQVLRTLKSIGYDSCTTASNHTLDAGPDGVTRTLAAMDAAGLAHTGSARSKKEAATPLIITTGSGVRVGQLAYTFGFNGIPRPADKPWIANQIDVAAITKAAHRLKKAGADIVVLSLHWGVEYDHLATATQRAQAAQLLASPDIDLIIGAHAHVVQPMEKIRGKWVVYGMGNQVARHANPVDASREGIMPVITFTERADGTFRATAAQIIPTWMQITPKLRLIDLKDALADPGLSAGKRATYRAALARIKSYVGAYGASVPARLLPVG